MEAKNKRQVIDRLKRVAMTNFFIAYAGKGCFVIKDSNPEATMKFTEEFNNIMSDCKCVFCCNCIAGPVYKII